MEVDDGYWRVDGESDTILECPVPAACVGASSSSYGDNLCRTGHEGPYCSVCEDGYFMEYNGLCKECTGESLTNSYILLSLISVMGVGLVILLIKSTCDLARKEGERATRSHSIFDQFERATINIATRTIDKARSVRKSFTSSFSSETLDLEEEEEKKSRSHTNQLVLVKIKIAFVFFQVILLFQEVYIINYPSPYIDFLSFFSFIELDLFSVAKMECAISGGFFSKLIFSTCIPIGISFFLFVGWIFSSFKFERETRQFKIIENTLINLFIIMTYVLFPSLCATIFSSFICEEFDDGSSFLRADYSVDCDSSEYSSIFGLAAMMILVYPIGIPSMYLLMLWRNQEKLDPQKFFTEMGLGEAVVKRERNVNHLKFLFDAFLPQYWWTEVMECVRKLLLTGFMVFFYEGSGLQIFTSMLVSGFFFAIYSKIEPYLMPSNNTFAIFVHFQIAFTLACTLLLRVNENLSNEEKDQMQFNTNSISTALVISNASVLLIGSIFVIKSCFNTSEADFLDVGFDEHVKDKDERDEDESEEGKEGMKTDIANDQDNEIEMMNPIMYLK